MSCVDRSQDHGLSGRAGLEFAFAGRGACPGEGHEPDRVAAVAPLGDRTVDDGAAVGGDTDVNLVELRLQEPQLVDVALHPGGGPEVGRQHALDGLQAVELALRRHDSLGERRPVSVTDPSSKHFQARGVDDVTVGAEEGEEVHLGPELKRAGEVVHLGEAGAGAVGAPGALPLVDPVVAGAAHVAPVVVQRREEVAELPLVRYPSISNRFVFTVVSLSQWGSQQIELLLCQRRRRRCCTS